MDSGRKNGQEPDDRSAPRTRREIPKLRILDGAAGARVPVGPLGSRNKQVRRSHVFQNPLESDPRK